MSWYASNARTPAKVEVGDIPKRKVVIAALHGELIHERIMKMNPSLTKSSGPYMGLYTKVYEELNKEIKADPQRNAEIEAMQRQWSNSGPPADKRRKFVNSTGVPAVFNVSHRDADMSLSKRVNQFARTMYLEMGVRMVVLGAWIGSDRKKKWTM